MSGKQEPVGQPALELRIQGPATPAKVAAVAKLLGAVLKAAGAPEDSVTIEITEHAVVPRRRAAKPRKGAPR